MDSKRMHIANAAAVSGAPGEARPPCRHAAWTGGKRGDAGSSGARGPMDHGSGREVRGEEQGRARRKGFPAASPEAGRVWIAWSEGRVDIRLPDGLTEACLQGLGDGLVEALCGRAERIVLRAGAVGTVPLGACGLLECFGRHLAGEGRDRLFEILGRGPGVEALTAAFRRGCARPARPPEAV